MLGKTAGAVAPKLLKQLPLHQVKHVTTEVLSTAKDPSNYQDRAVQNQWHRTCKANDGFF